MKMQRLRIQKKLIELANAGPFFAVDYDASTGHPKDIDPATAPKVTPASALANEVQSTFDRDPRYGRGLKLQRQSWQFQLMLSFHQEVTLETFEQQLLDDPPVLEDDPANGLEQATLIPRLTSVEHPTTQEPASGTRAVMNFEAVLGRN